MKISIFTLGCKTNYYESAQMAQLLQDNGHDVSLELTQADVFVINTCAITKQAEHKSRQAIARARKLNSNCKVIVVGCATQHNSDSFEAIDNVTLIKGTHGKENIVDIIDQVGVQIDSLPSVYSRRSIAMQSKARAFVKIQDGCNNFCNYCIVPYLRGRSRSRAVDDILAEIEGISNNEIVLIGIDISQYGVDIGTDLVQLLNALQGCNKRIRLGSLEVSVVTPQFVKALQNINFCQHLHLSLQSGCDITLKAMNRHYTTTDFSNAVQLLRSSFPNIALTCDIIVGFCGESQQHFQQTLQYAHMCNFADIHIFPYSPREGTVSYNWKDDVSTIEKKRRVALLNEVKVQSVANYLNANIGNVTTVVAEEKIGQYWQGYSDNYITVLWQGDCQSGQQLAVRLTAVLDDKMLGEVITNE